MIANYNVTNKKDDIKIITGVIVIFLFVLWLCTPPGNKFVQICFFGNHTKHFVATIVDKDSATEYLFHRNNAVYLVKMDRKNEALIEMDKAIKMYPLYKSDKGLSDLYRDSAKIKIFLGMQKDAFEDYLKVENLDYTDRFTLGLLYNAIGRPREAYSYCNYLIETDSRSYMGFACIAQIYSDLGKVTSAIKLYDLLIDRVPNVAQYYFDRAEYKKLIGDISGYNEDMAKVAEYNQKVNRESSIINKTLHPKNLDLSIL